MKVNSIRLVNVEKIINNWYPGDYEPIGCMRIGPCAPFHTCSSLTPKEQWLEVSEQLRNNHRFSLIYKAIKNAGFTAALAAKLENDERIIVCDGHHRLIVAWELGMKEIPIFVGGKRRDIKDMVAMDSRMWYGSGVDSPFQLLTKE